MPRFPDILLVADAAPVGQPCLGRLTRVDDDAGRVVHGPHARVIAVRFDPVLPDWPEARIGAFRTVAGRAVDELRGCEGLRADAAERLLQGWRAALASTVRLGGRPAWAGSYFVDAEDFTTAAVEGLAAVLRGGTRPTQARLIDWLADHRGEHFRHSAAGRVSEWCGRAGVPWKELKRRAYLLA